MAESCKRVKPFRKDVETAAINAFVPEGWPMEAPMRVSFRFHFKRPPSHFTSKGALTKRAPIEAVSHGLGDIDKLCRATADGLTGILYHDDRQIVEMHSNKVYDDRDLVIISLQPIANP